MSSMISYCTSLFVLAELLCNDSENLEKKMFSTLSDPVEVKYANELWNNKLFCFVSTFNISSRAF